MEVAEATGAGSEEWALAHEALSKLRQKRGALDAEEGTWLLRAFRAATHAYFGYASFGEYIERLFGLSRRATEEKLRVAGALEALPELAEALRSAKLNWSVVRELSRVAVPATEHEWMLAACGKTARQVERMVSGLAPGDRPADRRRSELVRHILRLEVGAETLATFREAIKELRKRSDRRLDDDTALLLMAREVLGGPGDAGRASYQLVVTQCEDCGRGFQYANGELIELDPAIVEMCRCDAQNVPIAPVHGLTTDAPDGPITNAGNLAQARAPVDSTDEVAHAHTGVDEFAGAHAHTGITDELAGVHFRAGITDELAGAHFACIHAGNAGELAHAHAHMGRDAGVRGAGMKRRRATQSTPPAIRREVFWRDRGRCVVPGCRNVTFVDLHHLELRSEGGDNHGRDAAALGRRSRQLSLAQGQGQGQGQTLALLRALHCAGRRVAHGWLQTERIGVVNAAEIAAPAFGNRDRAADRRNVARGNHDLGTPGAVATPAARKREILELGEPDRTESIGVSEPGDVELSGAVRIGLR
jgi:hypothetical protein